MFVKLAWKGSCICTSNYFRILHFVCTEMTYNCEIFFSGMAQVLATTTLDLEQRELVTAMVFSADVLLAIISDVLDLSKVESGMKFSI